MAGQPVPAVIAEQRRADGTQLVVRVAGEIDMVTAPTLAEALELAQRQTEKDRDVTEIVVDLRPVEFLSAAGLEVLVRAHDRGHDAMRLRVVADQSAVTRPLRLTGLDELLGLRPDPDIPAPRIATNAPAQVTAQIRDETARARRTP